LEEANRRGNKRKADNITVVGYTCKVSPLKVAWTQTGGANGQREQMGGGGN